MQLYRLTRGLILAMLEELESLRQKAAEIEAILSSPSELWRVVKEELLEEGQQFLLVGVWVVAVGRAVDQVDQDRHYNAHEY